MSTLAQRVVWRAVPVGLITALIGYGLCRFYLTALQTFTSVTIEQSQDNPLQGPLYFGLAGFIITAAVECVRKDKKPPVKQQSQTPATVP